ncbi:MAG TPA: GAF domain-containing protein [Segeticoccus sp.]|nr:GAF domain-containing protein [Segeticoccus sp.]
MNADESGRLEVLRGFRILDTARSRPFDRIAAQAAAEFDCPMGILGFLDRDRIWFKSAVGVEGRREMPRRGAVSLDRVLRQDPFAVSDLAAEPGMADHVMVRDHGVRFFAAAPLLAGSGHCIGALVVMDTRPRTPTEEQLARLRDLATAAMHQLEQRLSVLGTLQSGAPVRPHHADALDVAQVLRQRRPLRVEVLEHDGPDRWVRVSGSVDSDVTEHLERELVRLLPCATEDGQRTPHLVLDLSGLEHFGAAAFSTLLTVLERARSAGSDVLVGRSSPAVRRALRGMDPRGRLRLVG